MEREFEGKKLLILGGNPETTPLVEIANSMGIKTIVSSGRHTDPAKKAAWKAYDVDGMDVPLGGVHREYNAVFVEGNAVGNLMFYGPGAGPLPTGSAVMGDVMEIARDILR